MTAERLTVNIRRATVVDAHLLSELGARTFSEAFAADNRPEDMAAYLSTAFTTDKLTSELLDPRSTFFVAEIEDSLAGYAKLYAGEAHASVAGPRPVELARIYSAREHLGRGVGLALMDACIEKARGEGHTTLWLGVWERNARAIAFYRKCGFREIGAQKFQLGSDAQTDVVMERAL